jgi:hypothetical protein
MSRHLGGKARHSKYNARKVHYNGMVFASEMEFRRYLQLKLLEKAGQISDLKRQVEYELIPKQYTKEGKHAERNVCYNADFVYYDHIRGCEVVEDAKGKRTADYVIKRKLMLYMKGIRIEEVKA